MGGGGETRIFPRFYGICSGGEGHCRFLKRGGKTGKNSFEKETDSRFEHIKCMKAAAHQLNMQDQSRGDWTGDSDFVSMGNIDGI